MERKIQSRILAGEYTNYCYDQCDDYLHSTSGSAANTDINGLSLADCHKRCNEVEEEFAELFDFDDNNYEYYDYGFDGFDDFEVGLLE